MAVATLRTPRTSKEPHDPSPSAVEGSPAAGRPGRRTLRASGRPAWADRFLQGSAVAIATLLAVRADLARPATLLARRPAPPRLASHAVVLAIAAAAVAVGGFRRPEAGLAMPLGTEAGALSADARLLLGPRAGEVQVRDALVRPAFSATTLAPAQPRMDVITYTVRPGDTPWDIGARFSVGAWSVLWSNDLDEGSIIKPGQQLRIPPVQGVVHAIAADDSLDVISKKYNVDPAAIVDFNGLKPGESLQPDKLLVVPGGALPITPRQVELAPALPAPRIQVPRPPLPGIPVRPAPSAPAQQRPAPPLPAPPPAPAPPPVPRPTGRLSWPTRGVITTYFSGWHPGIDVAAPLGTRIGAADGGTVSSAGWNSWGYGYRVVVNHENGYSTTYNHLSVISVRPGQVVGKGQLVGLMGSTGRSTGSHLHFEILRNGSFVNPLGALN